MSYKNYILALSLLLTACTSNQWRSSDVDEVFVTNIKLSGLKLFEYSLTRPGSQADSGDYYGGGTAKGSGKGNGKHSGGGGKGRGKGSGKSSDYSDMKLYLDEMLTLKLKNSGYCRDGYIELDSVYGRRELKIRGECEEGATKEDRIKFG